MKLCRFDDDRLGWVEGDSVQDVTAALDILPRHAWPLPRHDPLLANLAALRPRIESLRANARRLPLAGVKLLAPVANPGKILAAPVNYRKHLEEARGDPGIHHQKQVAEIQKIGLFLKATSSLVGPAEGVALRHLDRRNDHEIELAAVIGKPGRDIPRARAFERLGAALAPDGWLVLGAGETTIGQTDLIVPDRSRPSLYRHASHAGAPRSPELRRATG